MVDSNTFIDVIIHDRMSMQNFFILVVHINKILFFFFSVRDHFFFLGRQT